MKLSFKTIAIIGVCVLGALAIALTSSVPDNDCHQLVIYETCLAEIEKEDLKEGDELFEEMPDSYIWNAVGDRLETSSYGIFNVGRIYDGTEWRTVSYGVLGNVFVKDLDKDVIIDHAKNSYSPYYELKQMQKSLSRY